MARGVQVTKMNPWKRVRVIDAFFREKRQEALGNILVAKSAMTDDGQDIQSTLDDYMEEMFPNRANSEEFFEKYEEVVREEVGKEYKVDPVSEEAVQRHARQGAGEMGSLGDIPEPEPKQEDS